MGLSVCPATGEWKGGHEGLRARPDSSSRPDLHLNEKRELVHFGSMRCFCASLSRREW